MRVAEIFVRVNSEGVTLNQADFVLTLMSVFWDKGRRELEDFSRACKQPSTSASSPFNWFIQPQPPQLLRVTVALAFRRAVLKHVYTLLRGKELDTGTPDPTKRGEQLAALQAAQEKVLDLTNWHEFLQCLERAGFRGGKMISGHNGVIYTYALWLIGRVDYGVPLARLREIMAQWFFMVHTTSRYSGSFETQFERDLARLDEVPAGDAHGFVQAVSRVVDDTLTGDFWTITLPNDLATSASKSPALLAYVASLNILDADALLSSGRVRSWLDPAVLAKKGIERHHLFPRAHLRDQLGITDTRQVNQIANMALVEWSDNIKISDKPPAEYWPRQVEEARKRVSDERLQQQRYWHALPDGWDHMNYREFLPERRRLMALVVRDAHRHLRDPNYQPRYPATTSPPPAEGDRRSAHHGVALGELIDAGLLTVGAVLVPIQDLTDEVAEVTEDGRIRFGGAVYESPSAAAHAASGGPTNGWVFWIADTAAGQRTLAQLRDEHLTYNQS